MTEALVDRIVDVFQGNVPKELIIFLVSMLPVLELRGGMIAAKLLGVPLLKAFVICYIGNILPIPFILLFIRKIFQFLKRFSGTRKIVEKLEVRSMRQSEKVKRWRNWGLLLFVAVPLPGTGVWPGSAIATLFEMPRGKSALAIFLGNVTACLIMTLTTYGAVGLVG